MKKKKKKTGPLAAGVGTAGGLPDDAVVANVRVGAVDQKHVRPCRGVLRDGGVEGGGGENGGVVVDVAHQDRHRARSAQRGNAWRGTEVPVIPGFPPVTEVNQRQAEARGVIVHDAELICAPARASTANAPAALRPGRARLSAHHFGFPSSGAPPLQHALKQSTSKGLSVCETKSSWGPGPAQV